MFQIMLNEESVHRPSGVGLLWRQKAVAHAVNNAAHGWLNAQIL
jgi:hypothetical protein